MNLFRILFLGYYKPARFIEAIDRAQGPFLGLNAQLLRGILDSTLLYLPVALLGRKPPTAPFLTFFSYDNYYFTLIWLSPIVFLMQWLIGGTVFHTLFRIFNQKSDIDKILNITGMSGLVIAITLIVWDWAWYLIGFSNQYFLGSTHLLIDIWWIALVSFGMKKSLSCPYWLGIPGSIVALLFAMPFAVIIMRSPF